MKSFEINLKIKDVQALSGLAYNPSKALFLKARKSINTKPHHWLSLGTFCSYFNISYLDALAVLKNFYELE